MLQAQASLGQPQRAPSFRNPGSPLTEVEEERERAVEDMRALFASW